MDDAVALMTGLFADHERAERAYMSLAALGYTAADVRLLMTGETRDRFLAAAMHGRTRNSPLGALVMALVGERIPDERAGLYDQGLSAGGIVMGISPRTQQDAEHLQREWTAAGARQIVYACRRGRNAA